MKFFLKDKHIYVVENHDLVYNTIEGEVIVGDIFLSPDAKIQFSVNGGLFKEVKNNKIRIDKGEIKEAYFELTVRILNKDAVEVYTTDKIPLTHALILGQPIEHTYPEIIRSLIEATRRLDVQQQDIIKVLNYLDTKGEVL